MKKIIFQFCILFLFSADIFADNYSLSFDGDDDVYFGNNSSLNIRNNTTVMAWVKPNTYSGRQEIMTNDDVWYWEIRSNGNLNFERHGGSQVNCNNCLTHNEWQHIAIIRDGSNLHMYINAQEVASSGVSGTFNNISYGYYIGQHGHDNTLQYSGAIDEVSVWNTALTQTEIQSYMTTSPTGSESGLVGCWNFNEGTGTTVTDQTSNVNNGTINGATWSDGAPITIPLTQENIQDAVNLWVSDPSGAEAIYGHISNWDVSVVTDMSNLFYLKNTFNDDISDWDVSNVTSMYQMFHQASNFAGDLSDWDVSSVTNMQNMFYHDYGFNSDISGWDVSNVTNFMKMFEWTYQFDADLSDWNVSNATNMNQMFRNAEAFSSDLSDWDVSSVTNMNQLFRGTLNFDSDISAWDVSSVTNMSNMFQNASALSDENKCAIQTAFSSNPNWPYDWQEYCPPPMVTSVEITGTSGYRFLSSPVSGAVYGDLLDELWIQGMAGSDDPDNGGANAWTWNNSWNALTDLATDNYTAGSGVLVYVFADTDFDGTDNLPVTLNLNGTQNTSPVTIATNDDSWNLLGNPYGYALSIQQLAADNAGHGAVYIWDNTTNAYKIHNGTTGDIADGLIAPFQGFWSQANAGATSYTFTESSISSDAGTNYRTTTDDSNGSAVFTFTNGGYSSSTYLSFTPEGHINLDQADASRLLPMSSMEHLTSMIHESGKSLSINNLPLELSNDISMDMDVMMLLPVEGGYTTQEQDVIMEWDLSNIPEGMVFTLIDNTTGQTIDLDALETANITLPNKGLLSLESSGFMGTYPELSQSQFTLSVYGTLAAAEDDDILPERLALHSAYPNPFNPSTIISFNLSDADMVSLDIFDIAGRQVASLISEYMIPGSHQINWNPGNLPSGIYLVNLVVGTETFNQKITFIK